MSPSQTPERWPYSFNNNRYVLELAEQYDRCGHYQCFDPEACLDLSFVGARVQMLEREGYVNVRYADLQSDGRTLKQIDSMVLTLKGEKELEQLRSRDFLPSMTERVQNLGWVANTSIITSVLTVLALRAFGLTP